MKREKLCFYIGIGMLTVAVTVRLAAAGAFGKAWEVLTSPQAFKVMLFLETGKVMRPLPTFEEAPTEEVPPEEPAQPVFSQADAAFVAVKNYSSREPDVEKLLCQPLQWQLKNSGPTVLILHSCHADDEITDALYQLNQNFQLYNLSERYTTTMGKDSLHLVSVFFYTGCYHILLEWIKKDLPLSPKEVADLMLRLAIENFLE